MESLVVSTPAMTNNTAMRTLRSLSSLCVQVCLKCKYLTVELLGQRENASVRSTQVVKCPQRSGIVLYYQHVPVPFSLRPHHQSMCERLILIFAVQCFLCKKLFFSISCLYNPCHLQLYSKMAPQNKNMDIEKKNFLSVYMLQNRKGPNQCLEILGQGNPSEYGAQVLKQIVL